MEAAHYIWTDPQGSGRNLFATFRRVFRASPGTAAELNLFADAGYRLRVNGITVTYGPERFTPEHPHFDSVDLSPHLRGGENTIEVLVHSEGSTNFQHMPSRAGFIAWGAAGEHDLSTPGAWQCRANKDWDRRAERFSFAQGPLELLDTRLSDTDVWREPVLCEQQDHWGTLSERELPPPSLRERAAERVLLIAPVDGSERRVAFRYEGPQPERGSGPHVIPHRLCLHAAAAAKVSLGLYGGRYWMNGSELELEAGNADQGRRREAHVRLESGWNELVGLATCGDIYWPVIVGVPAGGLTVHATRDTADSRALVYTDAVPGSLADASAPGESMFSGESSHYVEKPESHSPCRELAWDLPDPDGLQRDAATAALPTRDFELPAGDAMAVIDMGDEFFGRLLLEISAGDGAILDVGYDERLDGNGTVGFYRREQNNNTADRYVLRGGRQRIEGFHERGGRYLQIAVRGSTTPVTVHRVALVAATADWPQTGSFSCSDPVLTWSWQAGVKTLQVSMGDGGWVDPWRERGLYLGDSIVEAHATRKFTADVRMSRWALRLWAQTQKPDGQMRDVTPGWKESPLVDYSLIWIMLLRDYVRESGDLELPGELWYCVPRILESPAYLEVDGGLWSSGELRTFTDWGAVQEARFGTNAALNVFRCAALDAAAELAALLGKDQTAGEYAGLRRAATTAFEAFWSPEAGRYLARLDVADPTATPAYHGNILALRYGLVPEERTRSVLDFILEGLERNLTFFPGHVELYFFYYLLPMLYDYGHAEVAERVMRSHYGLMKAYGATTLVETAERLVGGIGSYCHGWATANMVHLTERALGVQLPVPGDPDQVLIAPDAAELTWAAGSYPHPRGQIDVDWWLRGDRLFVRYTAPAGVTVRVEPRGSLASRLLVVCD